MQNLFSPHRISDFIDSYKTNAFMQMYDVVGYVYYTNSIIYGACLHAHMHLYQM